MAKRKYNWEIGDMIGYFKYLGESESNKENKHRKVHCECTKCGNEYDILVINLIRHKHGMCKSCNNKVYGKVNGLSSHPLYGVLKGMHRRCEYPNDHKYHNYGGRGITVCDEWADTAEGIQNFVTWSEEHGYKQGLQLDRFDNDKGYSPDNCRWVTPALNNFNKRNTKGYRFHNGGWNAYITVNKQMINLGTYGTEEEAREARRKAELEYYGENSPAYRE